MSATLTIARKELRALFQSPIAIIFLSVFLVLTLFLFFSQSRFFARNLADVRPLFQWLPLLLIVLVSAVTMRSWAEERKAGTLEVLLTLPVRTADLVLGKFLAGMALVGLALAFTLPLPLAVSFLGPMDWGPVLGGYFAAMLLAGAYMAIGLCVSARTDNQVVALMLTFVLGGLLYLVGSEMFTTFFAADNQQVLRQLGTGSRFLSIERGVLDLRDIAYYASLTAFFLTLNGVFLEWERLDTGSAHGRTRSRMLAGTVALVGLNAVLLNLWLQPVHRARVDLTAGGDYTISHVTRGVLQSLDEPVRIRAFMSETTHPMLAPLVPQIKDVLAEYAIYGGDKVQIEVEDPNTDEELEAEINEQYQIESVPFGVADRHSQSVVNAYFHLAVVYGDKFEVLDFQDLIEVRMDANGVNVKLKNLEYDLTRAIKRVSQDFETLDSLIAKLPSGAQITAYISPGTLPPEFMAVADTIRTVGKDISAIDPTKIAYQEIDPSGDEKLQQQLIDNFGIQPLAADLFGTQEFYLHLLVTTGTQAERIMPRADLKVPELRSALESSFRRAVPGQLKKVLLATEEPKQIPNPQLPPNMQRPADPPDYRIIERMLAQNHQVERSELLDGMIAEDVDVVVIGKMGKMNPRQQYAVDQFLMRGGSVIALAGAYRVQADQVSLKSVPEDPSLLSLLEHWGAEVGDTLVMSSENAPFPQPVQKRLPNGPVLQTLEMIPYPFFPDLRGEKLNSEHPITTGVTTMTMPWSSPVSVTAETLENREWSWLVQTGEDARLREGGRIEAEIGPDRLPTWPITGEPTQVKLGVAITGKFPSFFADKPNPLLANTGEGADESGRTLKASVAEGKVVVLGSSELVSDLLIQLAQGMQSEQHAGNIQLLQNVLDWTVEDTDLLSIRTAGAFTRTLAPLESWDSPRVRYLRVLSAVTDDPQSAIEGIVWLLVLIPVSAVVAVPQLRRRRLKAIPTPAEQA
jgi:ABC-2 type transport system permease protein